MFMIQLYDRYSIGNSVMESLLLFLAQQSVLLTRLQERYMQDTTLVTTIVCFIATKEINIIQYNCTTALSENIHLQKHTECTDIMLAT